MGMGSASSAASTGINAPGGNINKGGGVVMVIIVAIVLLVCVFIWRRN